MPLNRASNGAAIINDVVVPSAEMKLIDALAKITGSGLTVPELMRLKIGISSDAVAYTLLHRSEKRGVVQSKVARIVLSGTPLKRILWSLPDPIQALFDQEKQHAENHL